MTKPYDVENERAPDSTVDKVFLNRWSPRSLTSEGFAEKDLMSLFEAARWAPSSSNEQPWRFMYAMHDSPEWDKYFDLLVEFNQTWCKTAGALVVVISRNVTAEKDEQYTTHSFDTGAAWMSLALQARMKNLVAHGMGGFDYEKAKKVLNVPDNYTVEAMIAIGSQGNIEDLHERMQKSEKPNTRKPVSEFVSQGEFSKDWR